MVIKAQPFDQTTASYFDYLRRYKASGNLTGRVRFDDFIRYEKLLAENEFFISALHAQGKTRGGALPRLVRQMKDAQTALLIKEEGETTAGGDNTEVTA